MRILQVVVAEVAPLEQPEPVALVAVAPETQALTPMQVTELQTLVAVAVAVV